MRTPDVEEKKNGIAEKPRHRRPQPAAAAAAAAAVQLTARLLSAEATTSI